MMPANTIPNNPFDTLVANSAHPVDTLPQSSSLVEEELRRQFVEFRIAAGLTQADVHERLDWSLSKVHRIEKGLSRISVADALVMLDIYGIKDETVRGELSQKARFVKHLPKSKPDDLFSKDEISFLQHEAGASALRVYASDILPDMMQSPEYAEALTRVLSPDLDPERAKDLNNFRRDRAAYLLGQYGPKLHVILDETVLRRVVGGEKSSDADPAKYNIMALAINGLRRLHSAGCSNETAGAKNDQLNPHVTIQVAPFESGLHRLAGYPYSILDMPNDDSKPIVYVDGNLHSRSNGGLSESQAALYVDAFDELAQSIPGADQTEDILKWVLDSYAS